MALDQGRETEPHDIQGPAHFFGHRFPLELRNHIYRYITRHFLFVSDRTEAQSDTCLRPCFINLSDHIEVHNDLILEPCLVNRQFYKEYKAEINRTTYLQVHIDASNMRTSWHECLSFKCIHNHYLSHHILPHIRRLEIYVFYTDQEPWDHWKDSIPWITRSINDLVPRLLLLRVLSVEYKVFLPAFEEAMKQNPHSHLLFLALPERIQRNYMQHPIDVMRPMSAADTNVVVFTMQLVLSYVNWETARIFPRKLGDMISRHRGNYIEYFADVSELPAAYSWYGLDLRTKEVGDSFADIVHHCIQEYIDSMEHSPSSLVEGRDIAEYEHWRRTAAVLQPE